MKIRINGEEHHLKHPQSVAELLAALGMEKRPVLVELNGVALHQREHRSARVEAGAVIELVRMVAGG
ncbi:MAG: sulfur carrier protein ThiS [Verrucomicrobiales bacterium]